jgi:DNA-binding CsgD family transcriptional regulator
MAGTVVQSHRTFQHFAAGLHGHREPLTLVQYLLSGLQTLIPTDYNSWKEVSFQSHPKVMAVFSPQNPQAASLLPAFQRHVGEHPVCNYWRRSGLDTRVSAWSDVARRSEIECLPLYEEFYRPLGIRHQLMVVMEARPSHLIYFALNRGGESFTEQDRALLTALQPHVSHALQCVRDVQQLQSTVSSLTTFVDTLNQGVICVSADYRIRWASKRARSFLQTYCLGSSNTVHLPIPVQKWLVQTEQSTVSPRSAMVIQGQTGRLIVRALKEKKERFLFLEEVPQQPKFNVLKTFGLTDREAEVLGWIQRGKSNEEVATILSVGAQTVKKHLERIYSALGVTNRTEAALKAHDILRRSREG